ncbi:hypothetical protein TZ03_10890 [Pseudomonas sp. 10-1B]|nr:hypothetical protein TZ03_10890 [Pseudomonas sp. 10-1B]
MLFHCLDGYPEALGDFRLRNFVNFVHDKNGLAARGETCDGIDEQLKLALGVVSAHGGGCCTGNLWQFGDCRHPGGAAAIATIAAHGGVVGDFSQQCQGCPDVFFLAALKQLHAHVMHHLARHAPVAEATANVVHKLVVVTYQCGQQRRFGGIERHDAPRKRSLAPKRMGVSVNEK